MAIMKTTSSCVQQSHYSHPVDEGWSWVICFASFACLVLQGVAVQATSVLFLDLVDMFETTVTTASFSLTGFVLCIAIFCVLSPTVLVPMMKERLLTILTGMCLALASVGISMAPNVGFFILFYSAQGACYGILCVTTSGLTSSYFRRRRGLATTIVMTGLSAALVVAPTFIGELREEFGVRGAYLILAGVQLHVVPAACTLRPTSAYLSSNHSMTDKNAQDDSRSSDVLVQVSVDKISRKKDNKGCSSPIKCLSSHNDSDNHKPIQKGTNIQRCYRVQPWAKQSENLYVGWRQNKLVDEMRNLDFEKNLLAEGVDLQIPLISKYSDICSLPNKRVDPILDKQNGEFVISHIEQTQTNNKIKNFSESASFLRVQDNGSYSYSMWSLASVMGSVPMSLDIEDENVEKLGGEKTSRKENTFQNHQGIAEWKKSETRNQGRSLGFTKIWRYLHILDLFRSTAFRFHTVVCFPCGVLQYLLNYVPTIAVVQAGVSREEGALLLTLLGAVDLMSRLLVGLITDTRVLRPSQIIAMALFGLGSLCFCNQLFTTFNSMVIMAVGFGCFIGTRVSLHAALAVELVGEARMPQGMSLIMLGSTLSTAVHSPLLSSLMDVTTSFSVVLYYCGAALYVAAISYLLLPVLQAWDERRSELVPSNAKTSMSDGESGEAPAKCANMVLLGMKRTLLPAALSWKR